MSLPLADLAVCMSELSLSSSSRPSTESTDNSDAKWFACLAGHDYFTGNIPPADLLRFLHPQLLISTLITELTSRHTKTSESAGHDKWSFSMVHGWVHQAILESLPDLNQVVDPIDRFKSLLDVSDKLWCESKLLEAHWRITNHEKPDGVHLMRIAHIEIKWLYDGLVALETEYPHLQDAFDGHKNTRLDTYPQHHPLRVLQPYLQTFKALPNYQIYSTFDD